LVSIAIILYGGWRLRQSLVACPRATTPFILSAQEAGEVHHITGGRAKRDTPIRLNDEIELISGLKAEAISDRFGDGCLAFARQRDNHDHSFLFITGITLA